MFYQVVWIWRGVISCFPSVAIEWNKLDSSLPKVKSFTDFKNNILSFMRSKANSVLNCNNSKGLKFVTRLRLRLSLLREHKFKHSFQDSINPLWSCSLDVESTIHYFLQCPLFTIKRHTLLNTISQIDNKLLHSNESNLTQHLFCNPYRDTKTNTEILNATVNYVLTTLLRMSCFDKTLRLMHSYSLLDRDLLLILYFVIFHSQIPSLIICFLAVVYFLVYMDVFFRLSTLYRKKRGG